MRFRRHAWSALVCAQVALCACAAPEQQRRFDSVSDVYRSTPTSARRLADRIAEVDVPGGGRRLAEPFAADDPFLRLGQDSERLPASDLGLRWMHIATPEEPVEVIDSAILCPQGRSRDTLDVTFVDRRCLTVDYQLSEHCSVQLGVFQSLPIPGDGAWGLPGSVPLAEPLILRTYAEDDIVLFTGVSFRF